MHRYLLTYVLCSLVLILNAQTEPSPILFIYDASGSMWGQLENKTKQEIASEVLSESIEKLTTNQSIGLIAYGHRKKGDCDDIEYLVDLKNQSKKLVVEAISSLNPTGKTPLARSASMAINSLISSDSKATIILITDGIESCDGDLCQVVTDAKSNGIDFRMHIVGFGLKEGEKEELECAAAAGGGNYYDAQNTTGLTDVLNEATRETIDEPAGNFSVFATKNGEAVDAWIKARALSDKKDVDSDRTYKDTAFVYLPPGSYEIEIQPLENTDIPSTSITVEIKEGETIHRDISFDSGIINVSSLNNGEAWDATIRIYHSGTTQTAARGRTYGKSIDLEINPGTYDVNIKILKIKGIAIERTIEDIKVQSNQTTWIDHNFLSGIAKIGVQTATGELIDATVNFYEETSGSNVAGNRTYRSASSNPKEFLLNPGTYEVRVVTLGPHKGHNETFKLTVETGKTVEKTLTF